MQNDCQYAYRIVGSPRGGKRRLVVAASAVAAYALCDPKCTLQAESYLSAFQYADDFRRYLDERGTTESFDGVCWTPYLYFDIDREGDLQAALADTRKLVSVLQRDFAAPVEAITPYFSGSKGFHIGLNTALWMPLPSRSFHETARAMAEQLARQAGVAIDTAIYSKVQPFRTPNSRHPKTGFYKRRLSCVELAEWSLDAILKAAQQPESFDLDAEQYRINDRLRGVWVEAAQERRLATPKPTIHNPQADIARLNRQTIEFIRRGATEGDRHRVLFSASANLAEFGCPSELAHALLTEAGLDSGLAPSEVRRQIDCGLRKGGAE